MTLNDIKELVAYKKECVAHAAGELAEIERFLHHPGLTREGRRSLEADRAFAVERLSYAESLPTTPLGVGVEGLCLAGTVAPVLSSARLAQLGRFAGRSLGTGVNSLRTTAKSLVPLRIAGEGGASASRALVVRRVQEQEVGLLKLKQQLSDPTLVGEYRRVRGHHVHAKKAFEGHAKYDPYKGFSISKQFMKEFSVNHGIMTKTQQRLFRELAKSGNSNTLKEHTRIAVEALIEGGATREQARSIVARSQE